MKITRSQARVLERIYLTTECSNGVWDYAKLHYTQAKIADGMPTLVKSIDGVVTTDGDGFTMLPEKYGRGFRLTKKGRAAYLAHSKAAQRDAKRRSRK